jgi:hypothetical protein
MSRKLGSGGRLTLSGWLFNQLDLAGFAWRTKNSLFNRESIGEMGSFPPAPSYGFCFILAES